MPARQVPSCADARRPPAYSERMGAETAADHLDAAVPGASLPAASPSMPSYGADAWHPVGSRSAAATDVAPRLPRPRTTVLAIALTLMAAAAELVSAIVTVASVHVANTLTHRVTLLFADKPITVQQVRADVMIDVVAAGLAAVVLATLLVASSVLVWHGSGRARIVLTVATALALFGALSAVGLVAVALLLAAVTLVWMPPSTRWFRASRTRPDAPKG
jgi:hypothetical protein